LPSRGNDDREAAEQAASFLLGNAWDLDDENSLEGTRLRIQGDPERTGLLSVALQAHITQF
jgi:hypothetical protein